MGCLTAGKLYSERNSLRGACWAIICERICRDQWRRTPSTGAVTPAPMTALIEAKGAVWSVRWLGAVKHLHLKTEGSPWRWAVILPLLLTPSWTRPGASIRVYPTRNAGLDGKSLDHSTTAYGEHHPRAQGLSQPRALCKEIPPSQAEHHDVAPNRRSFSARIASPAHTCYGAADHVRHLVLGAAVPKKSQSRM
jgi:hypothetical protein